MCKESNKNQIYLETILPLKIIENNDDLKNFNVVKCHAIPKNSMDGFLSSIYQVHLELEDKTSKRKHTLNLIAKLLTDGNFREEANVVDMTINELFFYSDILPVYENFLKNSGKFEFNCTPRFYYGFFEIERESTETPESVFLFEDLTTDGYRLGPRDKLDEKHIMLLTESIAKLHAISYAVKIQDRKKFDELVGKFKEIPFHRKGTKTMFDALYNIALERVYRHFTSSDQPKNFKEAFLKLYNKFIPAPSKILQTFVDEDEVFNIIIHGDYNRNNVMFKYESVKGFENPIGLKMFDFQWTKYASPVLDLSFYLYMNLDPEIIDSSWDKILKFYHENLIFSLRKILNCDENDDRLKALNFQAFLKHFTDHAFYGCMISAHFLPIMLCDEATLPGVIAEFHNDLFSEKAKETCIPAGGPDALQRVIKNIKHAYEQGYLNRLIEN